MNLYTTIIIVFECHFDCKRSPSTLPEIRSTQNESKKCDHCNREFLIHITFFTGIPCIVAIGSLAHPLGHFHVLRGRYRCWWRRLVSPPQRNLQQLLWSAQRLLWHIFQTWDLKQYPYSLHPAERVTVCTDKKVNKMKIHTCFTSFNYTIRVGSYMAGLTIGPDGSRPMAPCAGDPFTLEGYEWSEESNPRRKVSSNIFP